MSAGHCEDEATGNHGKECHGHEGLGHPVDVGNAADKRRSDASHGNGKSQRNAGGEANARRQELLAQDDEGASST